MSYGFNTVTTANAVLNGFRGTAFSFTALWAQLHIGDPGAAQTANLSANTTRQQLTFAAASSGSIALASVPTAWNMSATETIVAISIWTAATGGSPVWDVALTASQNVNNGDTLTLSTCTLGIAPLSV